MKDQFRNQAQGIVRISGAELSQPSDIYKLFGCPPGYVGHDASAPHGKIRPELGKEIIITEIDKVHPSILAMINAREFRMLDGTTVPFEDVKIITEEQKAAAEEIERQVLASAGPLRREIPVPKLIKF